MSSSSTLSGEPIALSSSSTHSSQMATVLQSDPNSVQIFKHNIQIILESVLNLQNVARNALVGIQNAYHPGSSPVQTETYFGTLKQNLELLADMSVHTGVGALPVLPFPPVPTNPNPGSLSDPSTSGEGSTVPSESQMIADATRSIQILFERLKRVQESAGTVASLLQAPTVNAIQ
ncbi:hypothetical protein BDP27DRAFT_1314618 [Rhodocollybia butyracea]|uniref:Mediator of RNA polymerase II transcription subunit 29 n=1 Tax=Rhodocollybia butyracea TaxID=206335 RepID=A0A9P5UE47_9AGAR|nr:hypothetical protein BDP27DRAFT_1314618 [Rhodocollybia butyracea]